MAPGGQVAERLLDNPAIQPGHQVIAVRRREKRAGREQLPGPVSQAQKELEIAGAGFMPADGDDRLKEELQPALVHGPGQLSK